MAQQISAFPPVPLLTDAPEVFDPKAVTWNLFQANTLQPELNALATEAEANAGTAETKAAESLASAALSEEWATTTGALVAATDYAAKEWAQGTTAESAKRWATSTTGVSGGLKGARGYAQDANSSAVNASNSETAAANSAQSASDDAEQTALDRIATEQDRVQTEQDVVTSGNNADAALASEQKAAEWAESETEVEPGQYSAKYWAGQAGEVVSEGVIDDGQTSALTTWSSSKISTELDAKAEINDSTTSATSVWSSQKTNSELELKRDLTDTSFPRYDLASISTTATLDLATGNEFTVDASVARTLTFANVPAGRSMTVVLSITGASAITWPPGIRWHDATAPELGATWTIVVLNYDGANWSGVLGASA
ncbi:hypothetical protein [Herbaspirillum sp.]|jgi:hypothetical protein|uniref:hypothetical protein n=1 Tax=Herbaspirillum sp. TaxID=1890675 RepID=UPI000C0BA4A7|nr:hypothetical protein [Herbaspirillum sp.]MAF06174.1 hypothetical protein [Herbaspirillum sp.]|tara:strand:+ start:28767 stop:29879 length:1113 start_codon:yes stop_codon:yes gene_type:complete